MKNPLMHAAALALVALGGGSVRADVVFDSITGAKPVGYLAIASPILPFGESFTTSASTSRLTGVKIHLHNPARGTATGSITVSLSSDLDHSPGLPIATLGTISTASIAPGTWAVKEISGFAGPITLAANTRYWIRISANDASTLALSLTNKFDGVGVAEEYSFLPGQAQTNNVIGGSFQLMVSTTPALDPEVASGVFSGLAGLAELAYRLLQAPPAFVGAAEVE